ncbi:MAG: system sorbose subfamily component [Bacillota bacterium]|nr:system sorbose subfamily component [Bacillota bacterium]
MKNIVLTRIDDRLLHGQVVVSWIPSLKINEVLIVDDEYAKDDFMSSLIKESSPNNITVNVMSVENSAEYLNLDDNKNNLLILSRNVENIYKLIELNVKVSTVNVGGLGYSEGRKKIINSIHMSDSELEIFRKIELKGISVEIQMLPSDKVQKI